MILNTYNRDGVVVLQLVKIKGVSSEYSNSFTCGTELLLKYDSHHLCGRKIGAMVLQARLCSGTL